MIHDTDSPDERREAAMEERQARAWAYGELHRIERQEEAERELLAAVNAILLIWRSGDDPRSDRMLDALKDLDRQERSYQERGRRDR